MEIEYDEFEGTEGSDIKVDLIASGYEWTCPECDEFNEEIEITEDVVCRNCGTRFSVGETYHAYG